MTDRFSGDIQIGGKISAELFKNVNALLIEEGITDEGLDISGYGWFEDCVTGDMRRLIEFCKDNCIPLCIQWDAKYEFNSSVQFLIGDEDKEYLCTSEGEIATTISDMKKHGEMTVKEYIESLCIPQMPPLEIVGRYTIRWATNSEAIEGSLSEAIQRAKEIKDEYADDIMVMVIDEENKVRWDAHEAAYDRRHA